MKKLIPFNTKLFAVGIILSTLIYAYEKESGDGNAVGMYPIVYFIPWVIIVGINSVMLLIADRFAKNQISLYSFLLIVPLAIISFTFVFPSNSNKMFTLFGIVGLVVNSITAFKLYSQTNEQ